MATLEAGSAVAPEASVSSLSIADIIAYAVKSELDTDVAELKESEEDDGHSPVIPLFYSSDSRKQVSHRILEFLSQFHDENTEEGTLNYDNAASPVRNIVQGHLSTCFKLLSSFLMAVAENNTGNYKMTNGFLYLIEIYLNMIPTVLDFSFFIDLLTDLVKRIPVSSGKLLCEFLYQRATVIRNIFKTLESVAHTRVVQTAGAKMIGFARILESTLEENGDVDTPIHVFNLRVTLTSCIPISHLGVCNRQSLSADVPTFNKASAEEWKKRVELIAERRIQGITNFEINNYETISINNSIPNGTSGDTFDLKSYMGSVDDSTSSSYAIPHLPTYNLYSDYCDLLQFIFNPFVIMEKTQEYMDGLQSQFSSVSLYIMNLADKTHQCEYDMPWVIPLSSNLSTFIARCTSMAFWKTFLCASSLALQTLKISHKRTSPSESVYSMLREKSAGCLDHIEKSLNQCVSKISGLPSILERILSREKEWVLWKQRGCISDGCYPVTNDFLTNPSEPSQAPYKEEGNDMMNFVNLLSELESLSPIGDDGLPQLGANFALSVDNICLNRQSTAWYLTNRATDRPAASASMKMEQKLEDCIEKMRMDADPENGIEEEDRIKHDSMFRFRFNRLFSSRYVHKYMDLSNEDIASGSLECLVDSLHTPEKRVVKKPTFQETN
eukprot:XP_001611014.1 hypothetical protein [Babesia bovis T2Bo]